VLFRSPDQYCIVGIHFYEPKAFTHQRAFWSGVLPYSNRVQIYPGWLEATQKPVPREFVRSFDRLWNRTTLENMIRPVVECAGRAGAAIHCGEFGVYLQAPREARYLWLSDVVGLLNKYGIGWCYWTYRNMGFGVVGPEGRYADLDEYRLGFDERLLDLLTE